MGAVAAGVAIGGSLITGAIGRHEETESREQANALRLEQEQLATTDRSLKQTQQLNEVLAEQTAREGASGFALSSPSFAAISRDTFNKFASRS